MMRHSLALSAATAAIMVQLQLASAALPIAVLPRSAFQQTFMLPLAGQSNPAEYNLIMVADRGQLPHQAATGLGHFGKHCWLRLPSPL